MTDDPFLGLGQVGRCQILSKLGEGGMGLVYRGHHLELELEVAVKFLRPHLVESRGNAERFLREARLAARLNHPGIVRVFDCGQESGFHYIVMEYAAGQNVLELIEAEGPISVGRALDIVQDVIQALSDAMRQVALLHRDVKPDNILITNAGDVKLTDLGLAKRAADHQVQTVIGSTTPGVVLGTPHYMSPEQFVDPTTIDFRADVFSLGATLYHMLAGRRPFEGENVFAVMRNVAESEPPPLPDTIPERLHGLIAQMLSKDRNCRHSSYDVLLGELREIRASLSDSEEGYTVSVSASTRQTWIPSIRTTGQIPQPASPTENRVLLVVDIQNDFCPNGALAVPEGDQVVPAINQLSRKFRHVVLTQDWHCADHLSFASSHPGAKPLDRVELSYGTQVLWPDHCVELTPGAEFHADLEVEHCEMVIRKGFHREIDSYSAFYENDRQTPTGLAGYLRERGLNRIFIVGLATDFCVAYSALDARKLGFEVTVIEEACRGIDIDGSLDAAWEQMLAAGVVRA